MAGSLQFGEDYHVGQEIDLFGKQDNPLRPTLFGTVQRNGLDLDQEILRLEEEVAQLTEAIQEKTTVVTKKSQELYDIQYGEKKQRPDEEILTEVQRLQSQIERSKEITGVSVEKFNKQIVDSERLTRFSVGGTVLGNEYGVQFEVKTSEEGPVTVENLNVMVGEEILQRLHEPLLQISDNNSLSLFFSLIGDFSRWTNQRQETFQHFTQKYPESVSMDPDDSSVLVLQNPYIANSPALCVCWDFTINPLCQFHPDLRLEVIIHKQLQEADREGVMKKAPLMFQKMLASYGIERSIDSMVQLITGS
ncbi:centromere protein P-like [Ostrea edulis]|uniref:centromere protein P-like n=1 Tax=Ostrea edulis TaxID=37623 RepID=UPI0024AF0DD6|nr:centromere protein P-like [Ostrea edulis]